MAAAARRSLNRPGETEYASHTLAGVSGDSTTPWTIPDFVYHFYHGNGQAKTLRQVGLLAGVVEQYSYFDRGEGALRRITDEIAALARASGGIGAYSGEQQKGQGYYFGSVSFVFGRANVSYKTSGVSRLDGAMMVISGTTTFAFNDEFSDPVDIRQSLDYLNLEVALTAHCII